MQSSSRSPPGSPDEGPRKRRRVVVNSGALPTPTTSAAALSNTDATPNCSPQRATLPLPSILPDRPPTPPPEGWADVSPVVLQAAQIQIITTHEIANDRVGAYAGMRSAIDSALCGVSDITAMGEGGRRAACEGLQRILALGPRIAGERQYRLENDDLSALKLSLPASSVTLALGFDRRSLAPEDTLRDVCASAPVPGLSVGLRVRENGPKRSALCLPFLFAQDASGTTPKQSLLVAMRASLAVLGSLVENAHVARTRLWLRGRTLPAPPTGNSAHTSLGLLLAEEAELWVMHHRLGAREPYFAARAWSGRMDTPEFARVLANVLAAGERAQLVAKCLDVIKQGIDDRGAMTQTQDDQWSERRAFLAWAKNNIGDTKARLFERVLQARGRVDSHERVAKWVAECGCAQPVTEEETSRGDVDLHTL